MLNIKKLLTKILQEHRYTIRTNRFNSGSPLKIPCSGNQTYLMYGFIQGNFYAGCLVITVRNDGSDVTINDISTNTAPSNISGSYSNGVLTITTTHPAYSIVTLTSM